MINPETLMKEKFYILIIIFFHKGEKSLFFRLEEINQREQQQVNNARDIMIASFNHDMKNPILSSIYLNTKIYESWKTGKPLDEQDFF